MWKRYRLFHATDFQSLMYPCFIFCRILGIFPYKFNTLTFESSKLYYIMSTVVICVYCVLYLGLIYNVYNVPTFSFGDITRNFESVSFFTFTGIVMINTHVLSGPRMRLLQTMLKTSSKLSSESYQKMSRLIHTKDILGIILLFAQICIYYTMEMDVQTDPVTILLIAFSLYLSTITYLMNMLYINCVCVLKACFKSINDNLTHMQRLVVEDVKSCVPALIYHTQKTQFLLKLNALKKWHLTISETVQMLNLIFSLQLLAIIVMSFCNITFQTYTHVVRWQDGIFINLNMQFLGVLFTSMLYYVTKILLIVWACETGKNQAQKISTIVHDLLNSTNDKQIKYELQLFSLQILHRKNIFSAKGFTVDATLLVVIASNVTTYLIILVQFLNLTHSCDTLTANVIQ